MFLCSGMLFILMFWHVYRAALSLTVPSEANHVKQLIDSVSSGVPECHVEASLAVEDPELDYEISALQEL